jgi:hypothetical protein
MTYQSKWKSVLDVRQKRAFGNSLSKRRFVARFGFWLAAAPDQFTPFADRL